jgi:hypothetical protein
MSVSFSSYLPVKWKAQNKYLKVLVIAFSAVNKCQALFATNSGTSTQGLTLTDGNFCFTNNMNKASTQKMPEIFLEVRNYRYDHSLESSRGALSVMVFDSTIWNAFSEFFSKNLRPRLSKSKSSAQVLLTILKEDCSALYIPIPIPIPIPYCMNWKQWWLPATLPVLKNVLLTFHNRSTGKVTCPRWQVRRATGVEPFMFGPPPQVNESLCWGAQQWYFDWGPHKSIWNELMYSGFMAEFPREGPWAWSEARKHFTFY